MDHTKRGLLRMTLACTSLAITVLTTACQGIDKSQWSDRRINNETTTNETTIVNNGVTTVIHGPTHPTTLSRKQSTTHYLPSQKRSSYDVTGLTPGADPGQRNSATVTITVITTQATCWWLVSDGNSQRGCGRAQVPDMYGTVAAKLRKINGPDLVYLNLITQGHTIASEQAPGTNRYVTVTP